MFQINDDEFHKIQLRLSDDFADRVKAISAGELVLGFRPEHISLAEPSSSAPINTPSNVIRARTQLVEPLGAETYLHVKVGTQSLIARIAADTSVAAGQEVALALDLRKAHLFDPATERRL